MIVYKLRPRGEKYWYINDDLVAIDATMDLYKMGTVFEFKQVDMPQPYYESLSRFSILRWKKTKKKRGK